jgi:hypothetical protein
VHEPTDDRLQAVQWRCSVYSCVAALLPSREFRTEFELISVRAAPQHAMVGVDVDQGFLHGGRGR